MIHASVELVEAMRGVGPWPRPASEDESRADDAFVAACNGATERNFSNLVQASREWLDLEWGGAQSDDRMADCPVCLRLMREATDPVRWDALEERGLAPKLPLEDAA